jgi:HK97 gp10 family phage protein
MATPLPLFIAQLTAAKALIEPVTSRIMTKGGDQIAATGKKNAPFLTGSLMRSIKNHGVKASGSQLALSVTAGGESSPHDVDYAVYVHEGTSKMGPRPFLRNALNKHTPQIQKEIADVVQLLAAGKPGRISGSVKRG